MPIHPDLKELLPKRRLYDRDSLEPDHYLWTYDPSDAKVYVGHDRGRHPAHYLTHETLAPNVKHEGAIHGYAYPIEGGFRVTDWDHDEVKDPFVVKRIVGALRNENPSPALPSIRYHGAP
jgi:hypothetical protein